ncbi:MAG: hypothetical protein D6794_03385 [Deltaproteobacteria bacterium]|nr:MAG: hypothetical protein D6794_03385 [Deltaproteobacteria bacterium]
MITIDVSRLYAATGTAKLADLEHYEQQALELAGEGGEVCLTGPGPVWLYLRLAHALHGKVRRLAYESPVTGVVEIYNHNPF